MFGLMVSGGMEWNGVGWSHIPLSDFKKNEWNGMKCDETHSIQFGVYAMEWNTVMI